MMTSAKSTASCTSVVDSGIGLSNIQDDTDTLISEELDTLNAVNDNNNSNPVENRNEINARLAPPNIQPYSGVLEKGKDVIRPIAFKPMRFGNAGERYSSTPVLTRPGSRLTLYGSSYDIRYNNFSLDRKLRSSCQSVNCQSVNSSPPFNSLTSLPHELINYDSLESVNKSPNLNASLLDLTPSPSDSGVSELEAALRDRDSELAYLRQTMEHNEQVIFKVYQEKEKSWEREITRLKQLHENTLKSNAQKTMKLEQMLMVQSYQYQQEKKRLSLEIKKLQSLNERLSGEVKILGGKLDESEWNLCEKSGEIALMKTQIKNVQAENSSKTHELVQLKSDFREKEKELSELKSAVLSKNNLIDNLTSHIHQLELTVPEEQRLRQEVRELREELSEISMSEYEGLSPGRNYQRLIKSADLKSELEERERNFEKERVIWAQEKEKVLRYQRQLQMNYVQMYRRTRSLEEQVEVLNELIKKKNLSLMNVDSEVRKIVEL